MTKRASIAMLLTAFVFALTAAAAVAANVFGTAGDDFLQGTNAADYISGAQGNDELRGLDGPDELRGGSEADTIYGIDGPDAPMVGGLGRDTLVGGPDNDSIIADDDRDPDSVSCSGGNGDSARVEPTDLIDGQRVGTTPERVLETATTCENVSVTILN